MDGMYVAKTSGLTASGWQYKTASGWLTYQEALAAVAGERFAGVVDHHGRTVAITDALGALHTVSLDASIAVLQSVAISDRRGPRP